MRIPHQHLQLTTLCVLAFFSFLSQNVHAQKQGNVWYFGEEAGIDFNGATVAALTNGQMDNLEGVASIANERGELLFYTDGMEVYNKQHNVMKRFPGVPATLNGHNSSTQSGVIIPQPVRGSRYYVFTVDEEGGTMEYTIVDTTGDSGNGMLIQKPQVLLSASTEKITAVRHANKVDIWVIVHEWGNNKFYSYLMTGAGLSSSPVVSSIGRAHSGNTGYSKGYMKASPDGTKIACAIVGSQGWTSTTNGRWELYDFDNNTGKLSNAMEFNNSNEPTAVIDYDGAYGIEFSPTGRYLYVSHWDNRGSNDQIIQYDLQAGNKSFAAINASGYSVARESRNDFGALQLASDGKIYVSMRGRSRLGVIDKPNCPKAACGFTRNGPSLSGRDCSYGLPTFVQSYFSKKEFEYGTQDSTSGRSGICENDSTEFWVLDTTDLDSIFWDFGDPASGAANTSRLINPVHVYSGKGTFTVKAVLYRKSTTALCLLDTVERDVTIFDPPSLELGPDTAICQGEFVSYTGFTSNAVYLWHNGFTGPTISVTKSAKVYLELNRGGCVVSDTVNVTVDDYPTLSLDEDTIFCDGDSLFLFVNDYDTVYWSNGVTDSGFYAKTPGQYTVKAADGNCWSYDTIDVSYSLPPNFDLGKDTNMCAGDTLWLDATVPGSKVTYLWSDGKTTGTNYLYQNATISVEATDTVCTFKDTITALFYLPLPLDLGPDTSICSGDSFRLSAWLPGLFTFKWHDGSSDSIFSAKTAGKKKVIADDGICVLTDSVNITMLTPPTLSLGPDKELCVGDSVQLYPNPAPTGYQAYINGIPASADTFVKNGANYIFELRQVPSSICQVSDTIDVSDHALPTVDVGPDTLLCFGENYRLTPLVSVPVTALWNDGVTNLDRDFNPLIVKHLVVVHDGVCSGRDSANITIAAEIVVDLGRDTILCNDETITYDISGSGGPASTREWLDLSGSSLASGNSYTVNTPGNTVIAEVSEGRCTGRDTVVVTYVNSPVFELGADTVICDTEVLPLDISTSGATAADWSNGASGLNITVSSEGTYSVIASIGRCESRDTIDVGFTSFPTLTFETFEDAFCEPQSFDFNFTYPHTNYMWNDGDDQPSKTITSSGTHWLVAENACGKDSAGFSFEVDEFGCVILFPTAFSPNGDKLNEVFVPNGNILEYLDMQIWNRWGEKIHEGPADQGWNGTFNGQECPMGVYTWQVSYRKYVGGHSRVFTERGIVHLVR